MEIADDYDVVHIFSDDEVDEMLSKLHSILSSISSTYRSVMLCMTASKRMKTM